MWTVAAVLALGAGLPRPVRGQCPDGSPPPCGRPRQVLDTTRYAILPFAHREGSQTATLDGADCAELLSEAFGRWVEVRLADKTRTLRALRAYALGERAMRAWDLTAATSAFRTAIDADSEFAHAYLRLGQALLWTADSAPAAARDRVVIARQTGTLLAKLGGGDRALLLAQQAMFEERWPDACAKYREKLAADSTSFAAWY